MVIEDRRLIFTHGYYGPDWLVTAYGNQKHIYEPVVYENYKAIMLQPQTKAEKNRARLKQLRGRAGRWA